MKAIINGKIIQQDCILENKVLVFNKKIIDICDTVPKNCEVIDAKGMYISPGLIDIHIHGSKGADTMDGSVEAITAPKSKAVIIGSPNILLANNPTTTDDITTPTVDNIPTLNFTLFRTFKFISRPPSYNINAEPNVSIRLFSIGKDSILIKLSSAGPITIPAIRYKITSGIFIISLTFPSTIPVMAIAANINNKLLVAIASTVFSILSPLFDINF